jgi:HD-GYP domain-containing protein (c-di-GMP phosphodiesterase class II)
MERTDHYARILLSDCAGREGALGGHSEVVSSFVGAVAGRFDLPQRRREELLFGSLPHDIDKIGISERILLKPAALTPEERAVIELHPLIGHRLIEQVPALRPISPAVLHHHERFDGGGYPSGLRGEEIPLEARIICVADCFSAMIPSAPTADP